MALRRTSPPKPSYAWPVFLGLAGSLVAGTRARRTGHAAWSYWLVGTASTAVMGWALLTIMPAALGRGERARSIYGAIPSLDEHHPAEGYVPEGVPGVTDIPDVVADARQERAAPKAFAVEMDPAPVRPREL